MFLSMKMLYILAAIIILGIHQEVYGIGVNYGLLGNDLPLPDQTIATLKLRGLKKIRIFTPNQGVLQALRGSDIEVYVGTLNEDLPLLAQDPSFASKWIQNNIAPYAANVKISGVVAGNELETDPLGVYILGAIQNLDKALQAENIHNVPVTTTMSYGVMGVSYPPSNGSFNPKALEVITSVAGFLNRKGYPLLVNIYPYFSYVSDPVHINLDYALLNPGAKPVVDGNLSYTNLLFAMVDALYSALEAVGAGSVRVVISETGWPSAMGSYATISNAQAYNNNLVQLAESGKGTPKRPNNLLDAYIFAMYNENQKAAGIEQNWGLFYPNLTEVYHVEFSRKESALYVPKTFSRKIFQ